jgi:hypothetical protein
MALPTEKCSTALLNRCRHPAAEIRLEVTRVCIRVDRLVGTQAFEKSHERDRRQEESVEIGESRNRKTCFFQTSSQKSRSIPATMSIDIVMVAPKDFVRWDGQNEPSVGCEDFPPVSQCFSVVIKVFQDVKRA